MNQTPDVTIRYDHLVRETDRALLMRIDGVDVWLPKVCTWLDADEKVLTIPESLAVEKELV